ncbi:hypothetical protein J8I29_18500 [Labrys sp. LIt4]|uniref:hypothetical protein n=1 Tax=Labrys sp. LIt4 TaxID=2821355 RepID=UPI001AE0571E|nr:hypothetical protein [Labrys sp. LIt4]MBP0581326.1 hypothetical protein [Labrys sp. LIt4]
MHANFLRAGLCRGMALLGLIALAGCSAGPTADYSPGYSYVATNAGHGSAKGATGSVLVPDACLGPPADVQRPAWGTVEAAMPDLGAHLPPGCANAYNLQRMTERQSDLVEGRRMGPAAGVTTARAARKYLLGEKEGDASSSENLGGAGGSATQQSSD